MVVIVGVLVGAARTLRRLSAAVGSVLQRRLHLPRSLAVVAAAVITALVVVTVVDQVLARAALSAADAAFEAADEVVAPDLVAPTAPTRSGSPASLVRWATLGVEGRLFVTGGRGRAALAAASGHAPHEPVRAYVGLDSASTPRARARLAVAELERAGGFDRSVVVVTTGSGTGWVNPTAVDSVELMYGGDSAVVATQYSYLPSALSLLLDRTRAEQAGRLLFDAVSARVAAMPAERRPKVLVFGESLGVLGGEAAFTSLADVRARADGVLWTGPPSTSTLWSSLVARRDPGSREITPVYADGLLVRFATGPSGAKVPDAPWLAPHVLYLQHPSDPVVWWSPDLLLRRPDWLGEPRGADVSPDVRWSPLVTFWQLTVDLAHSQSVPDGHGHNYGDEVLPAWAEVAPPQGWTTADTARALAVLRG